MDAGPRAVAMLALGACLLSGSPSDASPAGAAIAGQPATSPATPARPGGRAPDKASAAALLAPVARAPAGLVAPSYFSWLTEPPREAPTGGWLLAQAQPTPQLEASRHVTTIVVPMRVSPASNSSAAESSAISDPVPAPVPLPPKRLAEVRRVILPALVPLPPPRLPETAPATALAMAPEAQPEDVAAMPDIAAEAEAAAPREDAAAPIDDSPEPANSRPTAERAPAHIEALIQRHAERFDVPAALVRRVAWRESRFDPRQRHGPYWGLMQIRVDTARGLGFRGAPKDLLDANTNMTYAVAYLANAYRVAGRDEKRAVMLYSRGYYYEAKRKRMLGSLIRTADIEP
ncbi:soluble lytic murein transglycosylase-like protein [Ancylobacter aquaticus]|uniref:Soluble lytic murein transglycosylase-like protein n=1 Tax=Ancylobacter aquaticus TaxID=100 RepID=A0A4R1IBD5_ANCAQ|nr:lytic transglycosylase domain-containing protein [Ancylobacter aquaticus]TCK30359.1 soluble lytic murein transglycosylase-like protein [Ancylobacter aquaticus]